MGVMPKVIPPTGREAATDAEIQALQAKSNGGQKAPDGFPRRTLDLLSTSEFILFGEDTTLVPKGSILFVPAKYQDNVVASPPGNLIRWTEFLAKYRGVVTFLDVTLDQASGKEPLDPAKLKAASDTGMIVVALHQRSPISVVPAPPAASPEKP